jgi:hypothetical protein
MNERIEKLIDQCTVQEFSDCTGGFETFDKEKFAELIVWECVREFVRKQPVSVNVSNRARHVFKHFGVEE